LAKAVIFLPMAISFVGAGVIWEYVYQYQAQGDQIGLLNGIVTALGFDPVPWTTTGPWINNVALIIVGVWMWTGFCMTILSAALKGVPAELLEAARVDGANEWTVFWKILVPIIAPTIAVVLTTMTVNVLKIFDIVYVMGKGQPGTQVIATRMYIEQFNKFNSGLSSAIAVVLILAVLPIGYLNKSTLRKIPLHLVIVFLCVMWIMPTVGLLVASFRPQQDVVDGGRSSRHAKQWDRMNINSTVRLVTALTARRSRKRTCPIRRSSSSTAARLH
jgi:ABC-type sugar transport system permease subunit